MRSFPSRITLVVQRVLLGLNAIQLGILSVGYVNSTLANKFPVLEGLFTPAVASTCTASGCWQSLVPFLATTYAALALVSVAALFFRPGRELRLAILAAASMHGLMAAARLFIVPAALYREGAAMKASTHQLIFGALLILCCFLPYPRPTAEQR